MQCYSLSNRLKKDFPNSKIEVIDYISKEAFCNYHITFARQMSLIFSVHDHAKKIRYIKGLFAYMINKMKWKRVPNDDLAKYFDHSIKYLPISNKHIISDDLNEITKYVNENYDIVIVGSDAVWNFQMRPFPNIYFLGKSVCIKKLSYAASSYAQQYKNLSDFYISNIRDAWRSFEYLGVRDRQTEHFIKFVDSNLVPHHNCDPTVFLDLEELKYYKKEVYNKLLKKGFNPKKKTICLMAENWLSSFVRTSISDEYQLVSVFKPSKYADINLIGINPFEWAICFSFFDITITHYFHGNLLSLKNATPTLVIEKKTPYNELYDSKIRDFMRRLNMLDRCYYEHDIQSNSLKNIIKDIINSDRKQIITALKKESESYYSFRAALQNLINQFS